MPEKENLSEEEKNLSEQAEEEEEIEAKEEEEEILEGEEETEEEKKFLDPSNLPKELLPTFKRMQSSFTKAMQGIASEREKIALYNKLMESPEQAVQMLAQKVGLKVSKEGEVAPATRAGDAGSDTAEWIRKVVREELGPAIGALKEEQAALKAQASINYLNNNFPDWYIYEDTMAELVKRHPSLRDDLDNLYELSKTGTERAVRTKKASQKTTTVITNSSKGRSGVVVPTKAKTVEEAFEIAKKSLGVR